MKNRWKILIGAGILLGLAMASAWLAACHQPASTVEDYKKLLRDKGEKLELSEVLPPSVPEESNSLEAVEEAFGMFGSGDEKIPDAMKMVAPGKAMTGWKQPEARGYDFTNSWGDFSAEVDADRPAVELLHEVLERPKLDFEMDYKLGAKLPLSHLPLMKQATQKLTAAAMCDLHNGDTGAATTNILTMLGLVERSTSDGLLISHLVRIAMGAIAVTPTWELLQATNVTDAQLAAVQKSWEQMDLLSDATNAMVVERAFGMDDIEKARASHEEYEEMFGPVSSMSGYGGSSSSGAWPFDLEAMTETPRYMVAEAMWRSSWSYADELRTLKSDQIILETLRTMQTNQSQFYKADYDAMISRLSSLGITDAGEAFFNALKIPSMSDVFSINGIVLKTLRMETARRVVVTAVALKRFELKNGKRPETLNELVPEFISTVVIDPFDGKPLRYHPNADGSYLLYSVGEDGVDDGGDPTNAAGYSSFNARSGLYWQNDHARDWVWPQPATAAEIKFYEDNPPK